MREESVTIKNLKINYRMFGEAPVTPVFSSEKTGPKKPFLILHGWGSNSQRWEAIGEALAQKGHMAVIPDLPGFGKSQAMETPWNIEKYVDWLREFSECVPGLGNGFNLVGHSFGGAVALKFSINNSQKIEKLFLVSAACKREKTSGKKALSILAKGAKAFSFFPYYREARKAFYKVFLKSDYSSVEGVMKETYLNVIAEDLAPYFPLVKVPTLIVWGDEDTYTPLAYGQAMHKGIEGSNFVVIEGVKHSVQIEAPRKLTESILSYT